MKSLQFFENTTAPLESDLLIVGADLDGIWDELSSLLLGHGGHIFQQDSDLNREGQEFTVCVSVSDSFISQKA